MEKKYQIFISSTYEDLRVPRDQVIKAVLEMGHIPVGMEMFSAGDEQQWEIIKRQIEQSDYYLVIVAHRYGSMIGDISYTEREYDYAATLGIPTLGFIVNDESQWPDNQKENNKEIQERLANFKAKVGGKMVSFWRGEEDLYGKCSIALMKAFQAYPRIGWIKADKADTAEMVKEITRLSRENHELRVQVESDKRRVEIERNSEVDRVIDALRNNDRPVSIFKRADKDWLKLEKTHLLKIFEAMAPDLIDEGAEEKLMQAVAFELSMETDLRRHAPVPTNYFRSWLADLSSLGLIAPSEKRHSVNDYNRYWTLLPFGREVHGRIRKNELLKGLAEVSDVEEEDQPAQ